MIERMPDLLMSVLRARLLVGYLGERAQYDWWPTAFFEQSSQTFLQPIFPKTIQLAQYQGVSEAACRLHDEHLSVGTYHLFRLPEEMEQVLYTLAREGSENLSPPIASGDKLAAIDALSEMAGGSDKVGAGPILIGNVGDILKNLPAIESIYRCAFVSKIQSFPFLVN